MNALKTIVSFLGIGVQEEVRNRIAHRNMPMVAVGAIVVALFAGMLAFCLFTGIPCPVEGFDEAAYETPATTARFKTTFVIALIMLAAIFAYAVTYLRRKRTQPRIAGVVVMVFAFLVAMVWGLSDSGRSAENQMLIFASIQFLVAGLLVMSPLSSLGYFTATFVMFGVALQLSDQMMARMSGELAYLGALDVLVSWVMYGLYRTSVERGIAVADKSRRDELTGAKNRHYLRDDFATFSGREMFVMLCDIDDFKHYNDTFGHDVGDALLQDFFFALREAFGDECTYRYGGDEFLVVSPEFGEEDFLRKAERCARDLKLVNIEGKPANLTFSGGYVFGTGHRDDDFRTMLHEADEYLLAIKQAGKNGVKGGPSAVR